MEGDSLPFLSLSKKQDAFASQQPYLMPTKCMNACFDYMMQ